MFKKIFLLFAFIFISTQTAMAIDFKNRTFTAKVEKVRLSAQLTAKGKSMSDDVSVTVPAVILDEPFIIRDVREPRDDYGEEINFYADYIKAHAEGHKDIVVSSWIEEKRAEKAELVNNPAIFKRITTHFSNNPSITIYGIIKQADSVSLLSDEGGLVTGVTLKMVNGEYKLAEPENDLELAIIEASFW